MKSPYFKDDNAPIFTSELDWRTAGAIVKCLSWPPESPHLKRFAPFYRTKILVSGEAEHSQGRTYLNDMMYLWICVSAQLEESNHARTEALFGDAEVYLNAFILPMKARWKLTPNTQILEGESADWLTVFTCSLIQHVKNLNFSWREIKQTLRALKRERERKIKHHLFQKRWQAKTKLNWITET